MRQGEERCGEGGKPKWSVRDREGREADVTWRFLSESNKARGLLLCAPLLSAALVFLQA